VSIRDGRLKKPLSDVFSRMNASIDFDRRLYREDIRGSIAYAKALEKRGILDLNETRTVIAGLLEIEREIASGTFDFRDEDEDIHMSIERRLFEKIGAAAHKLHTGRSRNEQVVLDERMHLIDVCGSIAEKILSLSKALVDRAKEHLPTIIPMYTHLRKAQPASLAHLFIAYVHALERNRERIKDFEKRLRVLPLGSGAATGSSIGIDRNALLRALPFDSLSGNSIDAVSARDFIVEFECICVMICVTLSRMAEDIIVYSSEEFGFLELPDDLTTTSSLLPQKKNPDSLELIRGKSARVTGSLVQIVTLMKGTPYTYNRDFQEDKEGLFDTIDTIMQCLPVLAAVIHGLQVNVDRIEHALERSGGTLFAADIAEYLAGKGVPFREAHRTVGEIVRFAGEKKMDLKELPLEQYRKFNEAFDSGVYELFDYIHSVNRHDVVGGTALKRVAGEIKRLERKFERLM
jgi:argininosuccinate lyase